MNAKDAKILRNDVVENVLAHAEVAGYAYEGRSSEGAVFSDGVDTLVLRAIVKAEGTDAKALVADYDAKQAKAAERKRKAAEAKAKAGK